MLRMMQVYKMLDTERREEFKVLFSDIKGEAEMLDDSPISWVVENNLDVLGLQFEDDKQFHEFVEDVKDSEKVQRMIRVVDMLEE